MARISIRGVTKRYGDAAAVQNLSLEIADKEFISLLGPSGCGKTTTLQLLAGFSSPDEGEIHIDDKLISGPNFNLLPEKRQMGMVFQDYAVWPHKTVVDNVAFGLQVRRRDRREIQAQVEKTLETVGLSGLGERYPGQLSGGQQQRVALARALVVRPGILLLDEPLSNLDARLRDKMRTELGALQKRYGVTSVYVTHDQIEAMQLSDRIVVMSGGVVQQIGTPAEVYQRPVNRFVAEFMGAVNFVEAEVVRAAEGKALLRAFGTLLLEVSTHWPCEAGERVTLAVRPVDLEICESGAMPDAVKGTVRRRTYLGRNTIYLVQVADSLLEIDVHPRHDHEEASELFLRIAAERCSVMPLT